MARDNEGFVKHEIKEITFFIIFGILVAIVLPVSLGFILEGFEESFVSGRPLEFGDILVTYLIYYVIILGGLIGLPVLKIREMYITDRGEHPATQNKPSVFSVAYLHDPEQDGALWDLFRFLGYKEQKNPMRWSLSMFRVFIIGFLVFGILGILQLLNPTTFQAIGIPQLPFQVTETVEVLFTVEPPAFAETTLWLFILSILMGVNAYTSSRLKLGKGFYWATAFIIIAPIIGLGWMGFHNIVYGDSEQALFAVFLFGFLGSTITIAFGTWILWYVWHVDNNLFAKLREVVPSNEDLVFVSIIIWIAIFITYIVGEVIIRRVKRKLFIPNSVS